MTDDLDRGGPVFLPAGRELRERASQTFLRHANMCMRSGYLYALHKGEAKTVDMMRGSVVHRAIELATEFAIERDEQRIPPDVAKSLLEEVLADPEYPLPLEEHDYVRESVARWAGSAVIDVENVISVERLFVLDVDGWEVRAKVDYAVLCDGGRRVHIDDYKSSRGAPTWEQVSRKRPDGTLMARNFQLVLYALVVAFGVPVQMIECSECWGSGVWKVDEGLPERCPTCKGRQRVERREPLGVARAATEFTMDFVFPGIVGGEDAQGNQLPLRRGVSLTRLELEETRASLAGLLRRIAIAESSGEWPAVQSDEACSQCPSSVSCPIPQTLRPHRGEINTLEQAAEAAELLAYEKKDHAARKKELKAFADAQGVEIRFGRDGVMRFKQKEKTEIVKRDDMFVAVQRAVDFGEEFDRGKYVKTRVATEFDFDTLSDDELAAEAAREEQEQDG